MMKRFLALIMCVATSLTAFVACTDPKDDKPETIGSGTITYNTSTEDIAGAFVQSDEDTTILYFTPDEVTFPTLETARYYVRITLDTTQLTGATLDPAKGEVSVELIDVAFENELKAVSGSVSVSGSATISAYDVSLNVALDDEQSIVALSFDGGCINAGAIAYANEWSYLHPTAGIATSIIWEAFFDKRSADKHYIYLVPIKDITFEEVEYFSPVKITIPADVALDGSRLQFATQSGLSILYGPNEWGKNEAPNGYVKISCDEDRSGATLTVRFDTKKTFKGYYSGPVTIIR